MTDKEIAELRMVMKYGPIKPKKFGEKMNPNLKWKETILGATQTLNNWKKQGMVEEVWNKNGSISFEGYKLTDEGEEKLKAALGGEL